MSTASATHITAVASILGSARDVPEISSAPDTSGRWLSSGLPSRATLGRSSVASDELLTITRHHSKLSQQLDEARKSVLESSGAASGNTEWARIQVRHDLAIQDLDIRLVEAQRVAMLVMKRSADDVIRAVTK